MSDKDRTHFGYKEVDTDAKAGMVADVFHSVAARYDLMNDLMSGGIHRIWKRFTIELSGVRTGNAVLDIAGGTGDLAARFADIVGPTGRVVLADINDSMLKVGRDKLLDNGRQGNLEFVQADAQYLPFPDNSFDIVILHLILAVIPDPIKCFKETERVVKSGGQITVFDKFVGKDKKISSIRHMLNGITNLLFSEIKRDFESIHASTQLQLISDEKADFNGNFRLIRLIKN